MTGGGDRNDGHGVQAKLRGGGIGHSVFGMNRNIIDIIGMYY
jgi:hypothetical protein